MRRKLNGKSWWVSRRRHPARSSEWGSVDPAKKIVYLDADLSGCELLEIWIHEGLHIYLPHADEAWVRRVARDLARVYWQLEHGNEGKPVKYGPI